MNIKYFPAKTLVVTVLAAFVLLVTGLTAWNYVTYHNAHHNCLEIEALKSRVRARALEDHAHLAVNAKLLGIKLTPELQKAENKALARTLKDYAPEKCRGLFG